MNNNFEITIDEPDGNKILQKYIDQIHEDTKDWECEGINTPWFRGQNVSTLPPLPVIFRKEHKDDIGNFDEFWLSTTFRNRAPNFGETPENRPDIDKWLFLMRHMELPTRLLDWSESALVALFMAVSKSKKDKMPAVWMINPVALNNISLDINPDLEKDKLLINDDVFPNTWVKDKRALENIRLAFKHPGETLAGYNPTNLPLAIQLTYCHSRMSAQKGCFTVYGLIEKDFESLFDINNVFVKKGYFKKYKFNSGMAIDIYKELQKLGITYSTVYPDLIGLAKELTDRFFYKDSKNDLDIVNTFSSLEIKTVSIESETLQGLHEKYKEFLSDKFKEDNFYSLERTDFWKDNNKYIYYISYRIKK